MAVVHFYEKPGCINNTRQKQILEHAGHLLVVHDLLNIPWIEKREVLRSFFGPLPVGEWFNRSAPAVKNGDVHPELVTERQAIELMIADPLLIRRPLLEAQGQRRVGFDQESIDAWLGLKEANDNADLETCPKQQRGCSP